MLRAYRTQAAITLGSFLATVWVPFVNRSKLGDLSDWYGDHLHHPFATWVAFTKGLVIYTRTFSEVWSDTGFAHPMLSWGQMPMAYPPGVFAVFTPTMLVGQYIPMSLHSFGVINIVYLLMLAHLSFFAVLISFKEAPVGSRATAAVIIWMFIILLASEGFYDTVFIGAGAMVSFELLKKRPARALCWLSAGALLHFRMAAFAPLGLYALHQLWVGRKEHPLPWKTLVFTAFAAATCIWSFWMMYPATLAFQAVSPPVLPPGSQGHTVVLVLSLVTAAVAFVFADYVVALIVLICLGLCLVERQPYWWHAAILLAPVLAVGATGKARQPSVARAVIVAWAVSISPLVWRDPAFNLVRSFAIAFKL